MFPLSHRSMVLSTVVSTGYDGTVVRRERLEDEMEDEMEARRGLPGRAAAGGGAR